MRNPYVAGVAFIVLLVASTAASAVSMEPPKRKSGLWEIKISGTQAKGMPAIQECIDEKTDDLMQRGMTGMEDLSCSKNDMRKQGDQIIAESVCKVNGSTAKTRVVFSGRFDSAYKADIHSTYEPPLMGTQEASWVLEAHWVGPCKPGQKPGDVSIPGMPPGMPNINVDEMMKRAPKKP